MLRATACLLIASLALPRPAAAQETSALRPTALASYATHQLPVAEEAAALKYQVLVLGEAGPVLHGDEAAPLLGARIGGEFAFDVAFCA